MSDNLQSNFLLKALMELYRLPSTVARLLSKAPPAALKQGAYGKVPVHEQSLLWALLVPAQFISLIRFKKLKDSIQKVSLCKEDTDDVRFCAEMLGKVSRSFALVIKLLPSELRLGVCIFYLVLRVLDTIEDDMNLDPALKVELLTSFHERLDRKPQSMKLENIGEKDELHLLNNFDRVLNVFDMLQSDVKDVITSITQQMASGMILYVSRDLGNGTKDEEDFFKYCHYVAGTVGHGLSRLFLLQQTITCDTEDYSSSALYKKAESMAQILQRTNIIRDYLEDVVEGRAFWPKDLYNKYLPSNSKNDLFQLISSPKKMNCLNEMISKTLEFAPEMMEYLDLIQDAEVFAFCAIPQLMALKTLEECYNNQKVFTGVVKMSKAQSSQIFLKLVPGDLATMKADVKRVIFDSVKVIKKIAINIDDSATVAVCDVIIN